MGVGLDIVVVNYRTDSDLDGFVRSLHSSDSYIPYDLWIVNVDPQGVDLVTADKLVAKYGGNHIVHNENIGYARACNDASTRGVRPVLAFFNADTRIKPGVLESCYKALMANNDWAVLGPRQTDERGRITHAGIFGTLEQPAHRAWMTADKKEYSDVREAVTVSGSAYFVKRHIWSELTSCDLYQASSSNAVGAFLPTKHYYEETFCSYHAQAHGYKVIYYGPVSMIHRWHKASPVGGWAEKEMKVSQKFFREACDHHDIPHD